MKSLITLFKIYTSFTIAFLISLTISSTIFPIIPTSAESVSGAASSDISVTVENPWYITVSSSAGSGSGITLDYTAESGNKLGTVVTATDTVKTTSNTGQTKYLYISTSSNSNNLTNNNTDLEDSKTYISAGGGDTLASATTLSDNTWGFNIENNNNFTKVPILGNDIVIQEEVGAENVETGEYESAQNVYFGALATSALNAGKYSNTILYTAFTTEPPEGETRTLEDITYMQEATTAICENTPEADTSGNNIFTLKDSRDKKDYKVAHLKDGNCWMVQNLALDGGITLHPSDSNVTEDRILNSNISDGTRMTDTRDYIYSGVAASYTSSCDSSYDYCVTSTEPYGNHYNWIAATAGVGTASSDATVYESVCPSAGDGETWRLPDNDTAIGAKTYSNLTTAYRLLTVNTINGPAVRTIQRPPLSFPLSGHYSTSVKQAYEAFYWSRTSVSGSVAHAYDLFFNSKSGDFWPQRTFDKVHGFSVRCVLGE